MNIPTLMQSEELRAPWNELETPKKKFGVTCSQSLSKTVLVMTDNYVSDTDWGEEYHDNDYHTPLQLIELFAKYLREEIEYSYIDTPIRNPKAMQELLEECEGWTEDETEYIEES